MKNKLCIPLLIILLSPSLYGQQVTRLNQLPEITPVLTRVWNKAMNQAEVVGNDFYTEQRIGFAPAERFYVGVDWWKPIDGYKRTLGGIIDSIYLWWEGVNNEDINIDINNSKILPQFNSLYQQALQQALALDEDAADRGLQLEIDLTVSHGNEFLNSGIHRPRTTYRDGKGDSIYAYGPLVFDLGHDSKPEIHPAEQVWWHRRSASTDNFFLFFSCDESDRFDDKRDYDLDDVNETTFIPWAKRPLSGIFAIPFVVIPGKTMARFNLTVISERNAGRYTDGPSHVLLYKNDTLAKIKELYGADIMKVSFKHVCKGFDATGGAVLGFIVIEMQAGKATTSVIDNDQGGYLFIKTERSILPVPKRVAFPNTQ
jgi:hypothetical protein